MQPQYAKLTASGATVDPAWSDLSLYVAKRLPYLNIMTVNMQKVKTCSGADICANILLHAEILVFNNPEDAKLHSETCKC